MNLERKIHETLTKIQECANKARKKTKDKKKDGAYIDAHNLHGHLPRNVG